MLRIVASPTFDFIFSLDRLGELLAVLALILAAGGLGWLWGRRQRLSRCAGCGKRVITTLVRRDGAVYHAVCWQRARR